MSLKNFKSGLNTQRKHSSKEAPHVIVDAKAGTGKTFTQVLGIAHIFRAEIWETVVEKLGFDPVPSPQQKEIWDVMAQGTRPRSITYVAFNKAIVTEFEAKYQWMIEALKGIGVSLQFRTLHSLGFLSCAQGLKLQRKAMNNYKVWDAMEKVSGMSCKDTMKRNPELVKGVEELVKLCKVNLLEPTLENLEQLTMHHGLNLNGSEGKVFELVPQVLEATVNRDDVVDFNDMIFFPIHKSLPIPQADLLLVDEAQDLNPCQQALSLKAGKRIVFCGDENQAIYGFTGADCDSIQNLKNTLEATKRGLQVLPLTVTRRCGKAIVEAVGGLVEGFEAHQDNGEGEVTSLKADVYTEALMSGHMVLCRVNAPLVSLVFRLLKEKKKATIQGRNIGEGLMSLVKKLGGKDMKELVENLHAWEEREQDKLKNRKHPSESAQANLTDKADCLRAFCAGCETMEEVLEAIQAVFTDNREEGILLSSVHRSKGLEADTVFIIHPEKLPLPNVKGVWQYKQELNLKYVAITRAIKKLVWVTNLGPEATTGEVKK